VTLQSRCVTLPNYKKLFWPIVGLAAVVFSLWLLVNELRTLSLAEILTSIEMIPADRWFFIVGATIAAYVALGEYDQMALRHLGRKIAWRFVFLCSFTTYALSHNIGATVLSGAVVRYRAYSSKGLSAAEVGVLVALCSFTFVMAILILGGLVLVTHPHIVRRLVDIPDGAAVGIGSLMLAFIAFYVIGSLFHFRPFIVGGFQIYYPRPPIVAAQFIVAPLEVIAAAAIIYFALPAEGNPGYIVILGIFIASFSAALISHAPGGLGVIEFIFVAALSEIDQADVVAALIIFRIFYLLIPLALSLLIILAFERSQMNEEGSG
jgi:uncharacterized membrane protein YbhN (UPF0104 family)